MQYLGLILMFPLSLHVTFFCLLACLIFFFNFFSFSLGAGKAITYWIIIIEINSLFSVRFLLARIWVGLCIMFAIDARNFKFLMFLTLSFLLTMSPRILF